MLCQLSGPPWAVLELTIGSVIGTPKKSVVKSPIFSVVPRTSALQTGNQVDTDTLGVQCKTCVD